MRELILASASPRRRELLGQIGIPFQVIVSGEEEKVTETDPGETVKALSAQKALRVAGQEEAGRIVLGADTVVAIDGKNSGETQGPGRTRFGCCRGCREEPIPYLPG